MPVAMQLQSYHHRCVRRHAANRPLPAYTALHSAARLGQASRSGVSTPAVASSASSTASLEALRVLIGGKGASVDKVAVVGDVASGKPLLVAARDAKPGETVLTVPSSAWISPEAVGKHPLGPKLAGLDTWLQVSLVLIAERFGSSKGSAEWSSYVASLPETLGSPFFWGESELGLIQGTQLLSSTAAYKSFFMSRFEALQAELFSADPAVFPPSIFTPDNFLWAVGTVRSRVHAPLEEDKLAIVPLADAVSHSRNANVMWQLKSAGLFGRGQTLALEVVRPVKQGEALKMDFGPGKLDNNILLDYGVIDAANAQGGYTLTLDLDENDPNLDDKLDILETQGMGGSAAFTLTADRDPPSDMLAFMRLSQLSGADTFLLESVFREEAWGHMCNPISEENELSICQTLSLGANEALVQYTGSIDDDLQLLRMLGPEAKGSEAEAALMIRLGEKEALDAVARYFEQREALMPTLEFYQERRLKRLGLMDDKGNTTYDGFFDKGIA